MEPVALDSILETSTAFWLCNVQSQPWPVALGCPSLVMRPSLCLQMALGRGEWAEVGNEQEQQQPKKPTLQPLAAGEGMPEL